MKKFTLKASVLAIAAALPGMSFAAAVDLDATTPVPVKYASEQTVAGTGTALAAGAAADLTATTTLGASFAADAQAYVRVDITGGTFTAAPAIATLDTTPAAATTSVSQGGGATDSYVIFAIAPAAAKSLVGANAADITVNGVTVTSQAGVTMTYRLFETLTAAANPSSSNTLKTASATFISFSPALTFASTAVDSAVADVSAAGGAYTAFTGADSDKALSKVQLTLNTVALQSGAAATAAAVAKDTNAVAVSGDFTFAVNDDATYTGAALNRIGLNTDATCAAANNYNSATLNATDATFTGAVTAAHLVTGLYLCVDAEGTPVINASSYTGTVDLVAQTGYSLSDGNMTLSPITRNGTTLKAPMMTGAAGQYTYAQLANTSSIDAVYSVNCYAPTGASTSGTGGTLAAGNTAKIYMGNLGCGAGSNAVEFILAVPAGSVVGSVVRQNATTGDTGIDSLVGNQ